MNVKLLKDLNFESKINSIEAVSEAGKEFLKNYRGYMYVNPSSFSLVNNFISEANKYRYDTGVISILESINSFIKEHKISWALATACESINNNDSTYNVLSKLGVEQVEKLLEMDEKDIIAYIKAGSLKNVQYIPEFRVICREVYKQNVNESSQIFNYTISNPVSYIYECENSKYFSVYDKTFKIENGDIFESSCDDKLFNEMNNTLSHFNKVDDKLLMEFNLIGGNTVTFSVYEDNDKPMVNITKGKINETFDDSIRFLNYCDTLSRTMYMTERSSFMNVMNMANKVFENYSNIYVLDNVKILNSTNSSVCAIIEGKNNVNVTVFKSTGFGKSSINYSSMAEALNDVVKVSGVNLAYLYEDRINNECKKSDEYNDMKQQMLESKKAQMQIKKDKIRMLAEKYKNDPLKLATLSKCAKELALLES